MEFFGIGPLEILLILIIALIVLGPKEMVSTGRTIGGFLRRVFKSSTWQTLQQTSRELRHLPERLMHETGIDEQLSDFKSIGKEIDELGKISHTIPRDQTPLTGVTTHDFSAWTTPPPNGLKEISIPSTLPESQSEDQDQADEKK